MDRNKRKELLEAYKELKTYMGTIQITNKANGKIFVESYPNLKNKWMTIQMSLGMGQFPNFELQKDWNELGQMRLTMRSWNRRNPTRWLM